MPINYKDYPDNWKTEIRPYVLSRACNHCEFCGVSNGAEILRGVWQDIECYQDMGGNIYDANNSKFIGADYVGEVSSVNKIITVVLTVAHLDHDVKNNDMDNLRALCQRCHNRWDKEHRKVSRQLKRERRNLLLFEEVK